MLMINNNEDIIASVHSKFTDDIVSDIKNILKQGRKQSYLFS